jgi:two-component system, NarL family, nitrate/nitrite response regulator NarL
MPDRPTGDESLHIAIVDDHPLFREGVAHILEQQAGIEVVAQGASASDAIAIAERHLPDVMLLDVSMPGGGLAAIRHIATAWPVIRVIMLTVSEQEDDVTTALRAGARAYVLKGVSSRDLTRVVRAVAAGEVYVTPSLATSLLYDLSSGSGGGGSGGGNGGAAATSAGGGRPARLLDDLTDREREILEHVAEGDSNKEIAVRLQISEKTVKHHMTNILQKLQARNRVEAALIARTHGTGRGAG